MIFLRPNNIFEFLFQSLINTIFRLRQSIKKKLIQKVENNIFISGEFFEKISKKNSNIAFSSLDSFPLKKDYLKYKKKIWIFHNSDEIFDLNVKKKLDHFHPKKCFSQNLVFEKKNFHFIPIGLENSKFHNNGDIKDFLKLRKIQLKKKSRILFGFKNTNPKRAILREKFRKLDLTDETSGWNSFFYRRILLNYMFVICPEGNGVDTHRLWEALYLRTIPIIEKNKISPFIKKANLPVLIINKWSDLSKYNEKKLRDFYISNKRLFKNDYLFQNYWKKKIK
tara:strand:+ start:1017 stop:1859 length:843 start_codon:yes stop_codon:yes gene_type:complete